MLCLYMTMASGQFVKGLQITSYPRNEYLTNFYIPGGGNRLNVLPTAIVCERANVTVCFKAIKLLGSKFQISHFTSDLFDD